MKENNNKNAPSSKRVFGAGMEKLIPENSKKNCEIFGLDPQELLTPEHLFDVLPKYLYAKAREKGALTQWTTNLHLKYLIVHNKLFDGSKKTSANDFLKSFHTILDSIKEEGFMAEKSVIPINQNMDFVDGNHRIAAALVYGKKVAVSRVKDQWKTLNFEELHKRGFDSEYLDQAILQYCRLKPKTRLAIMFPIIKEKYGKIEEMLAQHNICYKKDIYFNQTGIGNLIAQMYKPKDWLNTQTRERHANRRFVKGKPVRILVLEPKNNKALVKTKTEIRKMFHHETLPIHTSDDQEETVRLAEQLFNENSVHFFNNANPTKYQNFYEQFQHYKSWLQEGGHDKENFCVDGGAILAVYGLRDCGDIDYIDFKNIRCNHENIDSHNDFLHLHEKPLKELVFDPPNYFYYDGYKFLTPSLLGKMKQRRKDIQDKDDIELILSLSPSSSSVKKLKTLFSLKNIWNYVVIRLGRILWTSYRYSPKWLKPIILKIYHLIFKKMYQRIRKFLWNY